MNDTPRTDAAEKHAYEFKDEYTPVCESKIVRQLERELNAANDRIRQLEAVVNDPESLWTNWLRGTVKLPSGIGDVRQYQERIKRLAEAGDKMASAWDKEWLTEADIEAIIDDWHGAKEAKP